MFIYITSEINRVFKHECSNGSVCLIPFDSDILSILKDLKATDEELILICQSPEVLMANALRTSSFSYAIRTTQDSLQGLIDFLNSSIPAVCVRFSDFSDFSNLVGFDFPVQGFSPSRVEPEFLLAAKNVISITDFLRNAIEQLISFGFCSELTCNSLELERLLATLKKHYQVRDIADEYANKTNEKTEQSNLKANGGLSGSTCGSSDEYDLLLKHYHSVGEMFEGELEVHKNTISDREKLRREVHKLTLELNSIKQQVNNLNRKNHAEKCRSAWLLSCLRNMHSMLWKKNRSFRRNIEKQGEMLDSNPMFDSTYYVEKNPDVRHVGLSPTKHYLLYGAYEGRNPSPAFNSVKYIETYSDVASSGSHPLIHYIKFGQSEKRKVK